MRGGRGRESAMWTRTREEGEEMMQRCSRARRKEKKRKNLCWEGEEERETGYGNWRWKRGPQRGGGAELCPQPVQLRRKKRSDD